MEGFVNWLQGAAPKRVVYENAPLVLALCQIRFPLKLRIDDHLMARFQEQIEDQYPIPDRQVNSASIEISGNGKQVGIETPPLEIVWRFSDDSSEWTVTVTNSFISLETRSYSDFDEFLDRLSALVNIFGKVVRPGKVQRIGLRYINEIRGWGIGELDQAIRNELLGPLALAPFADASRHMAQVIVVDIQGAQINFNHGLFPEGTAVVPRPGHRPPHDPFYLLDFDVYQEIAPGAPALSWSPEIITRVKTFHDLIGDLFRWSTTDAYRSSLGIRS